MGEPLIQLVEELKRLDRKRQILGKLPTEDAILYDRIKLELNKRLGGGAANNRTELRVPTSLRVRYHTGKTFVNNFIHNMSNGGVFISTPHPLPLDSTVDLHLYFEDEQKEVVVTGKVVWENTQAGKNKDVTRAGMGVRFTNITAEAKVVIEKLIHEKLEEQAKYHDQEAEKSEKETKKFSIKTPIKDKKR